MDVLLDRTILHTSDGLIPIALATASKRDIDGNWVWAEILYLTMTSFSWSVVNIV